jgi:hypothetical protein
VSELNSHPILCVIQPAVAFLVASVEPTRPDHDDENATVIKLAGDFVREGRPAVDTINIAENSTLAEGLGKCVEDSSSLAGAIVPTVTDEDIGHGRHWRIGCSTAPSNRHTREERGTQKAEPKQTAFAICSGPFVLIGFEGQRPFSVDGSA